MKTIILHPTDVSQWHALVNEAQAATHLILNETTESYLVFLLVRFCHEPKLIESIVALDFLDCMQKPRPLQKELLKDVGDKSLLFCGLFPGMAQRRNVSLSYFSGMGQAAYLTVSEMHNTQNKDLFVQLSTQFVTLQNVLQAMHGEYLQFVKKNVEVYNSPLTNGV